MGRLVALVTLALLLTAAWVALLVAADRLHAAPATVAGAVLGVAATVVGQALARARRG